MIFIAHRGNLYGPNKETENTPSAIIEAIEHGFNCEIDVWVLNNQIWLGHDYPQRMVSISFLETYKEYLWIHCKHLDSLLYLKNKYNCFYHDKDTYTLTTTGVIWGNINSPLTTEGIQVMPELSSNFSFDSIGICTDYPIRYKELYTSCSFIPT